MKFSDIVSKATPTGIRCSTTHGLTFLAHVTSTGVRERVELEFKYVSLARDWPTSSGVTDKLLQPQFAHFRKLYIHSGICGFPKQDAQWAEDQLRHGHLAVPYA